MAGREFLEKIKIKIIDAHVNDSSDYDYIVDTAIHNTLADLFKWAEQSGANLTFMKKYLTEDYGLKLSVDAEFESSEDVALFKLTFGDLPCNKLVIDGREMEAKFVIAK